MIGERQRESLDVEQRIVDGIDRVAAPRIAVDPVAGLLLVARVAAREGELRPERLDRLVSIARERRLLGGSGGA